MYISREKCCEEMMQVRISGAQPFGSGPGRGNSQSLGPEACFKEPKKGQCHRRTGVRGQLKEAEVDSGSKDCNMQRNLDGLRGTFLSRAPTGPV